MKRCTKCGETKTIEDFTYTNAKHHIRRVNNWCSDCRRFPVTFDQELGRYVKKCSVCKETKPTTEFSRLHGRPRAFCRECTNARMREAYTKNPEKFREKAKVYAARHPEQLKATRKVTHAKWYSKPENRARKNTPHQKLRCKKYREANSDRYRAYGSARRARMYGAKGQPFTVEEIIERDGLICYLCSRELTRNEVTLDHVRPLSRGGAHAAFNIRIACRSCNCRKSTKLLSELDWYEGEDFTALDGIF